MYCEQCGKKISDNARFCRYCGAAVELLEEPKEAFIAPEETQDEPEEAPTEPEEASTDSEETPAEQAESEESLAVFEETPAEQAEPENTPIEPEEPFVAPEEANTSEIEPEETQAEPEEPPVVLEESPAEQAEPKEAPIEPEEPFVAPEEDDTPEIEPEEAQVEPEELPVVLEESSAEQVDSKEAPIEPEEPFVAPEEANTSEIEPEEAQAEPEELPVILKESPAEQAEPKEAPIEPKEPFVAPEEADTSEIEPEEAPIEPEEASTDSEETPSEQAEPENTPIEPEETSIAPEETQAEPEELPVVPETKNIDTPIEPEEADTSEIEPEEARVLSSLGGAKRLIAKVRSFLMWHLPRPARIALGILAGALLVALISLLITFGVREIRRTIVVGEIPDPEAYFGISGTSHSYSKDHLEIRFNDPSITLDMVQSYAKLLESSAYPFTRNYNAAADPGTYKYLFLYSGEKDLYHPLPWQVKIKYEPYDKYNNLTVTIENRRSFELVEAEPYSASSKTQQTPAQPQVSKPETEPEPEPQPEPEPETTGSGITYAGDPQYSGFAINGPTLPDPGAFFGGATPIEDVPADSNGWHLYYRLEIDDGWTAAQEYLELISDPRFHFELSDSFSNTVLYMHSEYYMFDYTGEGSVAPVHDRYYLDGYQDFAADLCIRFQRNGRDEYTGVSIYYSSDLSVVDLGDSASTVPGGSSGSSGGSDFGSDPVDVKTPCPNCHFQDGKCPSCDGYGRVNVRNADGTYHDRDCHDCTGGTCSRCGGKGWL